MKTLTIQQNNVVTQVTGNIVSDMDGEKVMFSITNGKYYNLGEIGGVIWELIHDPITVQAIIQNLLKQYDVDPLTCEEHVKSFLQMLKEEDLIVIQN